MRIRAQDSCLLIIDIQERLFPAIAEHAELAANTLWLQQVAQRIAATGYIRHPALARELVPARGIDAWRDAMSQRIAREVRSDAARFVRALCYHSLLTIYARPFTDGNGSKPGVPLRLLPEKGPANNGVEIRLRLFRLLCSPLF